MGDVKEMQQASGKPGFFGSLFRRKSAQSVLVPPMPHKDDLPPANITELNLIKEKVQGISLSMQKPEEMETRQIVSATVGPAPNSPLPSPAKPLTQPAPAAAPAAHTDIPKKSKLDELRDSIEESSRRKGHLKKNIESVNEHLNYVRRKSSLGEKKLEKLVGEKITEELGQMNASLKKRLASNPPKADREMLEDFQKQVIGLMDISDKRSHLELEQLRSQMDGIRKQISNIPSFIAQKEIDELSPLKEEVAVLRGELRKALPNVSDANERAKLEGTIARVEAISKVFGQSPQQDALRSELEEMRTQLVSIANAIEKNKEFEAGAEVRSVSQFGKLNEEMEEVKKRMDGLSRRFSSAIPEDLGPLRDELHSMRNSIRSIVASARSKEESELLGSLQKELDRVIAKGEERSAEEFGRLERNLSEVKRRISTIPAKIDDERPEFEMLKKELRSLKAVVDASLSQPKNEEEKKLLLGLQSRLEGLLEEGESRSLKEMETLRGELADVRRKVVGIPFRVGANARSEFGALSTDIAGLHRLISEELSKPRDEGERRLLKGLQSRLEGLLSDSQSRNAVGFDELRKELANVRAGVSRIPNIVGARERPELEAIRGEIVGLHGFVSDALSKPRNEEEEQLLRDLQARLENLMSESESRSAAGFGELRKELEDVRASVSRIPSRLEASERSGFDAIQEEIISMQKAVSTALARPRNEEEKRLLAGLQSRLEELAKASDARSSSEFKQLEGELSDIRSSVSRIPNIVGARERPELESIHTGFGELKQELADVRNSVSRIPSAVGAREKPELDALRAEIFSLQKMVSEELSRPKGEEEKRLLLNLQLRLEGLLAASESRSAAGFGELRKELSDVRSSVSHIPTIVGAREKQELEAVRSEISALQKLVGEELSKPRNEEEKKLLRGLQSRLEGLLSDSQSRNAVEFGELRKELSGVRSSISTIPSRVEADARSNFDSLRSEVLSLEKLISSALSRPKDEEEKRLLLGLRSRLEGLLDADVSRSAAEFSRLESELADIRSSVSRIPSIVGAHERHEFDTIKAEVLGLRKAVNEALSRPLDDYQKNILQGLQSRLEGLLKVSESHSVAELGKLEGELADVRERVSHMPGLLVSREKADMGFIQTEIDGLKKAVTEALSKPKDEAERRFLKGLESRLQGLLEVSEENSLQQVGELRKEIGEVRKKISNIPSHVEAEEEPKLESLRGEIRSLRSAVENALTRPKNGEEKELLRNILTQLDGMVKFFDIKESSAIEAVRSSGSRTGLAVDGIRSELEAMKGELLDAVSSEKPDLEALKAEVDKALAKRGNAAIEHELNSIRNQLKKGVENTAREDVSGIRENIAALRELLEKRNEKRVPRKKRKGKKAIAQKPLGKRRVLAGKKKAPVGRKPLKKFPRRMPSRALSDLKTILEDGRISRHGRSDVRSFLEQMEKRRNLKKHAIPEIERRLGGRYSSEHSYVGARRLREEDREAPRPERSSLRDEREFRSLREEPNKQDTLSERRIDRSSRPEPVEERKPSAPDKREDSHDTFESYLREEKMGRISSDVARMHNRLKDIKRLYKEEF